jgi:hypothetical protein
MSKLLGFFCLLLGIGPGIFLLAFGLMLIMTQLLFWTDDARGYAGLFGMIAFMIGILFSSLLIPAVKLLKFKAKYLIIPAVLVALFPIYSGFKNIIFEMKIQKQYKTEPDK